MMTILYLHFLLIASFGSYTVSYPTVDFSIADAQKSDVQYRLITNLDEDGTILTEESVASYDIVNKTLPTKLFIHGWTTDETSIWYSPLKNAYLTKGPHNIIYIDWSKSGNKSFPLSSANSKPIGEFIANFLIASKISLNQTHIIGHSLGSHVAGFIGKYVFEKTGEKISRITGTDPGWPMFEHPDVRLEDRLAKTDANFVDIIHTDIGHYGFIQPIGHVDFYPNGGTMQPGCPSLEIDDNCSHAKSNVYLIKSVNNTDILATECNSWVNYINSICRENRKVVFGENVPHNINGTFYFEIDASIDEFL